MYQGKYTKQNPTPKAPAAIETPKIDPKPAVAQPDLPREISSSANYPPVRRSSAPNNRKRRKRKNSKKGTYIFYSIYAAFILLFFIALICIMNPLQDWLVKFEASQPEHKQEQIFSEWFSDPDWKSIYTELGLKDTTFETADTFAEYMNEKVGTQELTCLETSAGLSGDKKFVVKCNDEKIATFTLTNDPASKDGITQWILGSMEFFYTRSKSVTVEKLPGHTVYINGGPLDESYTIQKVSTLSENYLPEGVHGYRLEVQQVTNLLTTPKITVKDELGNIVPVTLDPDSGIYVLDFSENTPTAEEKDLAVAATQTYAKYMIGKTTLSAVRELFDSSSQFYQTIAKSELGWVQSGASYTFTEPIFSDYYRYSDSIFSIKLDMTLKQTRFDGSVKDYSLNNTLFFQKNASGKWMVMEATNIDVQQKQDLVRLTFHNGDSVISSTFVDADASTLTLPQIAIPEGKVFKGWGTVTTDPNGKTTLTIVFNPTDSGVIYLPSGSSLSPMNLYAHFEEAAAE